MSSFGNAVVAPVVKSVIAGAMSPQGQNKWDRPLSPESQQTQEDLGNEPLSPKTLHSITGKALIIEEGEIAAKSAITWTELLDLLKAAYNPRFCRSLATAQDFVSNGGQGDSCSLLGGFPYVVKAAFPNAAEPFTKRGTDDKFNMVIYVVLEDYIQSPSLATWSKVEDNLKKVAPTAEDQTKLCNDLYEALSLFLKIALSKNSGEDVSLIMVKARMASNDRGPLYGPLGKTGSAKIKAEDVSPQIYHARTVMKEIPGPEKIGRMVNGILAIVADILKANPLK